MKQPAPDTRSRPTTSNSKQPATVLRLEADKSSANAAIPVRSRAAAAAILAGRGETARVLVLQRAKNSSRGLWSLVMGRLEPGETAIQAIRREIMEEAGIGSATLYTSGCCDTFYNPGANAIEIMPIFVATFAEQPDVTLDHEHLAYRWVSFAEAADLLAYPGQRQALIEIKRDFADRPPPSFRLLPA